MTKTKFQVDDKVQFVKNNGDFGYLKGTKGLVYDIKTTSDGRALYHVVYKDVLTGETTRGTFRSSELEKYEDKPKYPEFNPDFTFNTYEIEESEILEIESKKETRKHESNMFEVDDSSSWDDFCNNFKGELFKD